MSIRNIAIIAHVDHGKTTLIDAILQQSGVFHEKEQVAERIMDSNDLEKERGITILAKCTAVNWQNSKVNIIDTPGHADFGGEVERVLSMVEGVVLLVDSAEGAMPQTKFVLSKALSLGLKPIVVINKIDRPDRREDEVLDEIFDLFVSLEANDEQLDFPTIYASGRDGWAIKEIGDEQKDLAPLMDLVLEYVPEPKTREGDFAMLASILQPDSYLGPTLTGKVYAGTGKVNMSVKSLNLNDETVDQSRLTKLFTFKGVEKVPVEEVIAGDIVVVAGLPKTNVSNTICATNVEEAIQTTPIDPPTMSITLSVNDSPLAGRSGSKVTSRVIRDRLLEEAATNVAITFTEGKNNDSFEIGGRGELQLGVLIENMRREGFELSVSRPKVLFKKDEQGKLLEPIEEVVIDVDEEFSSAVIDRLNQRKAEMTEMKPTGGNKTRLIFKVPSRGMIGFQGEFLTITKGTGVLNRIFHSYEPHKGELNKRKNGVLISMNQGDAVGYALNNLQDRGIMFVDSGEAVYEGMIIGEHNRDNDLEVNILKAKQLTNFRAAGKDDAVKITPPKKMTLEQMIAYIETDELVEVTPEDLRLRKAILDPHARKRAAKKLDS